MIVFSKTTYLSFLVFESFGIEIINSEVKCLKQCLPQFRMYLNHLKKFFKQRMLTSLVLTWGGLLWVEYAKVQNIPPFWSFLFLAYKLNFENDYTNIMMVILVFAVNFCFVSELIKKSVCVLVNRLHRRLTVIACISWDN